MADRIAVAEKRARVESRLDRAAQAASALFGVPIRARTIAANRYPDLAAVERLETTAELIEAINAKAQELFHAQDNRERSVRGRRDHAAPAA